MHGFAQYPAAYLDYLYAICEKLNVVILAPTTGILSCEVWIKFMQGLLVRQAEKASRPCIRNHSC